MGTFQPHNDALVVTLQIEGFDVRKVLVDQGSGVEIMYPNLYKGLNLKSENLSRSDLALVGFDGRTVIPKGMINLPMNMSSEAVEVEFIIVNAYSPYTTILASLWLHTMGAVSSTLHMKVKYPSKGLIEELKRSQTMARQCMVVAIKHQSAEMCFFGLDNVS